MNRNAFTLIEVLVSVAILAVVATGLFQIAINSKNNFTFLANKAQFDRLASIPVTHNDPKYHRTEKSLYDFLREDYMIKEDKVIRFLKQKKISYEQENYATFAPFSQENSAQTDETLEEPSSDNLLEQGMELTLQFDKITISDKHHATYVYKVQLQ